MFELLNIFSIVLALILMVVLVVVPNLFFIFFKENKEVTIGTVFTLVLVLIVTGNALVLLAVGAAITFPLCARQGE